MAMAMAMAMAMRCARDSRRLNAAAVSHLDHLDGPSSEQHRV